MIPNAAGPPKTVSNAEGHGPAVASMGTDSRGSRLRGSSAGVFEIMVTNSSAVINGRGVVTVSGAGVAWEWWWWS